MVAWEKGAQAGSDDKHYKRQRYFKGVMGMFNNLIVVIVSQTYIHTDTYILTYVKPCTLIRYSLFPSIIPR